MPYESHVDPSLRLSFVRVHGVLTDEEIRDFVVSFGSDPNWSPGFHHLIDFTDVTEFRVSYSGVSDAAGHAGGLSDRLGDAKLAFVAPSELSFGIARQYGLMTDGLKRESRVFRDMESARRWLDLNADPIEQGGG